MNIRDFAITLLDDEHGIKLEAWELLKDELIDNDELDIVNAIKYTEGRVYLPTNFQIID